MPIPTATTVLLGGRLYHPGARDSRPGSIAIAGDRILAVGSDAEVRRLSGPATEIVDATGRLVIPGFQDAHIHPILGGVERLQCDLGETRSHAECVAKIRDYAAGSPGEPWVLGSGWSPEFFTDGVPHRRELDALIPDRPALLGGRDHHSVWANSRALEIAGVTASTPDPADGHLGRDADGEPDGNLYEGAMALVRRHAPQVDLELALRGLIATQGLLHGFGVTSWLDAILGYDLPRQLCVDAYLAAEGRGLLTMRAAGCVWWERDQGAEQLAAVRDTAAQLAAGMSAAHWRGTGVKIMVDGVTESGTAALSEPYRNADGHITDRRGDSYFDPAALCEYVTAIDAAGYTAHFHALGDRAVTEALDAVEAARHANGASGIPHHLAHVQLIAERDIPRFRTLGATANLQMLWACDVPPNTELTMPFIDPAFAKRLYPFGELHAAGAHLAAGADWPVTTPDPLQAIHVGVNRAFAPGARPFGGAQQCLDLATALTAYTAGTARIIGHGHETGRLEVGALADLAVLDRDLFAIPSAEIGQSCVIATYVGGREVFSREPEQV